MAQLDGEEQISALPPGVLGGLGGGAGGTAGGHERTTGGRGRQVKDTQAVAAKARAIIMEVERGLGFDPVDREFERLGYDIESRVPGSGQASLHRGQGPGER